MRITQEHAPTGGSRKQAGQALVELAIVVPVMVLLLSALAQFGIIFERQIGITNAVREAARRGATLATPDAGTAVTNASWTLGQLQSLLGNAQGYVSTQSRGLQVCFHTPAAPYNVDAAGNSQVVVTVTATYAHPLFLPLINIILDGIDGTNDNAFDMSATSEFRVEQSGSVDIGSPPCASG